MPTVTVPENSYVTISDVTSALGVWSFPAGWDADAQQRACIRAKQIIDSAIRTTYGQATLTLELNGSGTCYLDLREATDWPIRTVTSVLYRETPATAWGDAITVESDSYGISHSHHALERFAGTTIRSGGAGLFNPIWVKGFRNYRVVGSFGRSEVPEAIRRAAILIVREEAQPGYSLIHEKPVAEKFPDGYSVNRESLQAASGGGAIPTLTGNKVIDAILAPYVDQTPMMVSIR